MRSHWRLHAESFGGSMRRHLAAPCGVIRRLHAESFGGSMRSHLAAPCGVIRRLHAESFAGSMRSHSAAPSGVICWLSCEQSSGSKHSHHTSCSNWHFQLNPKLVRSIVRWGDANPWKRSRIRFSECKTLKMTFFDTYFFSEKHS